MKKYCGIIALLTLSACSPSMDMQGVNPVDYYAEHPIKNKIETHSQSFTLHYAKDQQRLSPGEIDRLSDNLHGISMLAVDSIQISFAKDDEDNKAHKEYLAKILRHMGYNKGEYVFKPSSSLKSGEVRLVVTYSTIALPDCPDWRTSPVTTHSNTTQGNFGCAHEVDMGLMVADPHDLVRGTADTPIDTVSAARAVEEYHEGKAPGSSSPVGSAFSGTSSGDTSGATAAPPPPQ